jgi:hypothetical protein
MKTYEAEITNGREVIKIKLPDYECKLVYRQPERSKREDSLICEEVRNEMKKFLQDTFDERINYCHQKELERCGALNSMET